MSEIHELFVLPLSLVWFARATPEKGFCQWPEMGSNVRKNGLLGAKVGENGSKPTFVPTSDPLTQTHSKPILRGKEIVSKKGPEAALTQHNLRI